ncbi:UvrD-helicase domain-containing protein [Caldibacillus debilis]|jgi:DNA helicase-2/ATP-dependent DNA helicase PcrA|uniref:DNA 3'-5' helicase n=1 Tax=Caldibacillus debilis TaxID=301148 RepID=A0A150MBU8_9BACI|nr:UvrD-helicase domain-containing protein [Caldibacillus debilis]KYD22020.1 hypothetical protein B4135_1525 [Caldibacillus debilis]
MNLTDEQKSIINSNERRLLVKAGAGTGKTEILVRRIVRLIEENPDLSITDMAIITFTNKATQEMQSRLKNAFYEKWKNEKFPKKKIKFRYELESLNSAQISTIHKFCETILQTIGPFQDEEIIYSPNFPVRSDQLTNTIDHTVEEWIQWKKYTNKKIEHLNYMPVHQLKEIIRAAYKMVRSKGLDLDKLIENTKRAAILETNTTKKNLKIELTELLKLVSENHVKYKWDHLDVDDLLEYCAKILKKRPDLVQIIRKKYQYIFIDEFQDTSLYQAEIIKSICDDSEGSPHLFVVGDIKQSIYEFRGANPESYQKVEHWIKQTGKILTLSKNWRSTPEVVTYVNRVFGRIKAHEKYSFQNEPLEPSQEKERMKISDAYEWVFSENNESQGKIVANYLQKQIEEGKEENQFAVLVRTNYQLSIIADCLEQFGIRFEVADSGNFFNQTEIVHTNLVLKAILHENPISANESLSTIFFNNDVFLYNHVMSEIRTNSLSLRYTPSQLLDYIYRKTDIFSRSSRQIKANLNKLKELTRSLVKDENITLGRYVNWLSAMIAANMDEPLADVIEEDYCKVKLMTIHKAKGLEFPVVILPFLDYNISNEALYPEVVVDPLHNCLEFSYDNYYYEGKGKIQSDLYDEVIKKIQFHIYSEELRVLYVALTRAKEKLVLIGNKNCRKDKICYQNWLLQG